MLLNAISQLVHKDAPVRGRHQLPLRALESHGSCLHGSVDIIGTGGLHRGNLLLGAGEMDVSTDPSTRGLGKNSRGVDGHDGLAGGGLDEFVVDEEARRLRIFDAVGGLEING